MTRERGIVISAFFVDHCQMLLIMTVSFILVKRLSLSTFQCGLVAATASLTYSISCFVFGKLSHTYGHKNSSRFGILFFAFITLCLIVNQSLFSILIIWPLAMVGLAFFWPALQAWLSAGKDPERITRDFSYFNFAWCLGMMTGSWAAGFLFELSPDSAFYLSLVVILAIVVVLSRTPDPPPELNKVENRSDAPALKIPPILILGWIGNFAAYFTLVIIRGIYADLGHQLGFSAPVIGILAGLQLGIQACCFLFLNLHPALLERKGVLLSGMVLGICGLGVLVFTLSPWLHALGMVLLGVMAAILYLFSQFHSVSRPDGGRALSDWHEGVLAMGGVLGPLLGGLAALALTDFPEISFRAPYVCGAIMLALAMLAAIFIDTSKDAGIDKIAS
jgi:MFS family permease